MAIMILKESDSLCSPKKLTRSRIVSRELVLGYSHNCKATEFDLDCPYEIITGSTSIILGANSLSISRCRALRDPRG